MAKKKGKKKFSGTFVVREVKPISYPLFGYGLFISLVNSGPFGREGVQMCSKEFKTILGKLVGRTVTVQEID